MRTKKVSWETIPTVSDIVGIANHGGSATLFTLSRAHFVHQYDITPGNVPMQVAEVQHVPSATPPTPPTTLEDSQSETPGLPMVSDTGESSADESAYMSPIHKIAKEMDSLDALQSELRDKVMPLSPTSSRASSASSRSSGARRRDRKYLYDRPDSSRASSNSGYDGTEFSMGVPSNRPGHESLSIRSVSSFASASNSRYRPTNLRKEVMRSPEESKNTAGMDLFPYTKARLRDVPFRTPHYGTAPRTPELLQREMLSVIFGWNDTAQALIRDELERHRPGSASAVLLRKWLGDMGADNMASMVGSESMSSSDWMLLALSSIGSDSQRQVGEAFVQRLLEKGDVHPAVAILLGLGEHNDAIEIYVSQRYWVDAVLLTCLTCPSDWGRASYLIRKWGENAVQHGQAELAVRCFSCTSIETSEPWFSPRAQDAVYAAQQERLTQPPSAGPMSSSSVSPPSRSASGRLTAKNASLKLITTFGDKGAAVVGDATTPMNALGVTPIQQSAMPLSPGGVDPWTQTRTRNMRDPSSARTATPGGFSRRKRLPSRNDIERVQYETSDISTPITAARDFATANQFATSRRTSSVGSTQEPATALKDSAYSDRLAPDTALRGEIHLPSPAQGVFTRLKDETQARNSSLERKPEGLAVHVMETRYLDTPSQAAAMRDSDALSPVLTDGSSKSAKGRAIDDYISSVEEARERAREKRTRSKGRGKSRPRDESLGARATNRPRELSETRGPHDTRYIKPAKRSPSSPIPMSPEEIAQATQASKAEPATTDDESFYKLASPVDSHKSTRSHKSESRSERRRPSIAAASDTGPPPAPSPAPPPPPRARSRAASRQKSPDGLRPRADSGRGRSEQRTIGSTARSPSSPFPMSSEAEAPSLLDDTNSDGRRVRLRTGSRAEGEQRDRRDESRSRRERSSSRKPPQASEVSSMPASHISRISGMDSSTVSSASENRVLGSRGLSRKELAAKELEERRLSLARRPSAPSIPLPGDMRNHGQTGRPSLGQRSHTELGNSPTSYQPPMSRAQTVDPDQMSRYGRVTGVSTPSAPIGLPATPRAMRHPRYMGTDTDGEGTPPVPEIPDNASQLSSLGNASSLGYASQMSSLGNASQLSSTGSYSYVSQVTGSAVESNLMSNLTSNLTSNMSQLTGNSSQVTSNVSQVTSNSSNLSASELDDGVAPLLPSTVFGQKGLQAPPSRSASAPPEKAGGGVHPAYKPSLPPSNRRLSHVRKISPPDAVQATAASPTAGVTSIDEALAGSSEQQIVIIPEQPQPPVLPELQHLNIPPPPPPPTMPGGSNPSGVINIAMDDAPPLSAVEGPNTLPSTTYPQPMERATTASPTAHRRGRGSVSETFGRFRGFGDRMRSTSRNRAKSPTEYKASPYETVLPPVPSHHRRGESVGRAKSPYELAMASQEGGGAPQDQIPPPPPPPPPPSMGAEGKIYETTIPPSSLPPSRSTSAVGGYRNPKEIRANMPPDTLQQGVYQAGFL